MRVIFPVQASVRESLRALAASPRAIEKASHTSSLRREGSNDSPGGKQQTPHLTVELVCRDEAQRFDPFWDAPRLLPTFVTQVLGQMMPQPRESVSVQTAYGRAASPRMALLLDRKS
jgi:hypothetical protein